MSEVNGKNNNAWLGLESVSEAPNCVENAVMLVTTLIPKKIIKEACKKPSEYVRLFTYVSKNLGCSSFNKSLMIDCSGRKAAKNPPLNIDPTAWTILNLATKSTTQ